MKYLLDTSVFLWGMAAEERLNATARKVLTASSSELYLSVAGAGKSQSSSRSARFRFRRRLRNTFPMRNGCGAFKRSISPKNTPCVQANCLRITGIRLTG